MRKLFTKRIVPILPFLLIVFLNVGQVYAADFSYQYDQKGQLVSVTGDGGESETYDFDPAGNITELAGQLPSAALSHGHLTAGRLCPMGTAVR